MSLQEVTSIDKGRNGGPRSRLYVMRTLMKAKYKGEKMITDSVLTKKQTKQFTKLFKEDSRDYIIIAEVRFDDECGNGHNTFAITAEIWRAQNGHKIGRDCESCGCLHEEIAKHFPELKHLIKWHLMSTDGPMHYVANTVYHAGNRDHNGLLKGEVRQIRNGKLEEKPNIERYIDADECPSLSVNLSYVPWNIIGEGKERELDFARSSACWPEATDEELSVEPEELKKVLLARLPKLLEDFKSDMEGLGFVW